MLKQIYVHAAQTIPAVVPGGHRLYQPNAKRSAGTTWLASLGAIYHLDRMIALDIPWWNVASTRLVEAFLMDRPNANVWEYGSGASTIWLARRAGKVTSVEHDERWADKLRSRIAPFKNTTLLTAGFEVNDPTPSQPYVNSIDGSTEYDLIVVDGRLRTKCLDRALPYLKSDGIILFDDSGRQRYRAAIRKSGLKERRFFGLSYCVPYPDYTSVLTHRK